MKLTAHERFFTAALLEKVVLLALISVIFAQVLPDMRSSNLALAVGCQPSWSCSNAAVSQWLRRRGSSWSTTATTFVAMLVINIGIVTVDAVLGPGRRGNTPDLNTLFFVLLLSLLIALFDRFRATRDPLPVRATCGRACVPNVLPATSRRRRPRPITGADLADEVGAGLVTHNLNTLCGRRRHLPRASPQQDEAPRRGRLDA